MKRILLATDGSLHACEAAWFLAHLPHDERVEIVVVSILHLPFSDHSSPVSHWIESYLAQERLHAVKAFESVEAQFEGANVALSHVIRKGHPGETIVKIANELAPELVVIGAKGHTTADRLLLGSTSDYVATHAPCSVLVVRPTGMREATHPVRIVIGYEQTEPAQAAINEFGEFSWGAQPDVRLVNVSYVSGFFDLPDRSEMSKIVQKAAEQLHDVAPSARGERIERDHIGEGLVRYVEDENIDILVVGETPRTRIGRVLMGSMTRYVLRHAPCSVWITRNHMTSGAVDQSHETETASS